jgi:hypothetical protein
MIVPIHDYSVPDKVSDLEMIFRSTNKKADLLYYILEPPAVKNLRKNLICSAVLTICHGTMYMYPSKSRTNKILNDLETRDVVGGKPLEAL